MKGNDYYGAKAERYDKQREGQPQWIAEQKAIEEFVSEGPILDVPFGTGRFVPIYRQKGLEFVGVDISQDMLNVAKRKYSDIDVRIGSVFELDFDNSSFATVVCIRLLEWLPLARVEYAITELLRVARTIVVSVRLGVTGEGKTFTHSQSDFYNVIEGFFIEGRYTVVVDGTTNGEIFKLRRPQWSDVMDQFKFDYPISDVKLQARADKFGIAFGLPVIPIREDTTIVRAEYWTAEEIGTMLLDMSKHLDEGRPYKNQFINDKQPRRNDLPITVLERDGVRLIMDGRHRANFWMKQPGRHPVLVVRPL